MEQYQDFHSSKFGKITDIIWDGDNTIWDWMKYAVTAYEAMAKAIAAETGKTEDEVSAAMKKFYTQAGTIEDERLIQGLTKAGFFEGIANFDVNKIIEKAQQAFSNARRKNLHLYPEALQVFKTIHEHKIKNRILTDAPARQAKMRIARLKLAPFLKQVNALPSNNDPDLPPIFRAREQAGKYKVNFKVTEIPTQKPHTNLEEILQMTRAQIRQHVVIIGDNDLKDMELVRLFGCRGIHATYGESTAENLQRLLKFAPERIAKKNSSTSTPTASTKKPHQGLIVKVKSPAEILRVLKLDAP